MTDVDYTRTFTTDQPAEVVFDAINTDPWMSSGQSLTSLRFVPVDNAIAVRAVQLPSFPHRDPADRMIVATALGLGATLVTADKRLRSYAPLKTVWD